ncbi:MAG: glycosyltransferase family 2 protein [Desulfobacter sp.]
MHLDKIKYQFDILVRSLGSDKKPENFIAAIKPIMILIPAYNEAENLNVLLKKMPRSVCGKEVGVLVIDDGSMDDTSLVPNREGYVCVKNIINRGQGAACRLGYDLLRDENVEVLVTMDADNQHLPEDIKTLVKPIEENEFDLVIGSRIIGSHESEDRFRGIGISVLTKIINLITGLKLTDCSSGFKAFNVNELKRIHLREDQFQSSEVIIESAKKGLRVGEVPITIVKRKFGDSKKGTNWRYGFKFTKVIIKTWWR